MPIYSKLRDALERKKNAPEKTIPTSRPETFTIPNVGTFEIIVKDWGSLDNPTPVFDGMGVRSVVSSLVEYRGEDHSFSSYGKVFYNLLNTENGLQQIQKFSISGVSSPSSAAGGQEYYGLLHLQAHCERTVANAREIAARQSPERQPAAAVSIPQAQPTQAQPAQAQPALSSMQADAVKALQALRVSPREAEMWVRSVQGNTVGELTKNALAAREQAKKPATQVEARQPLREQDMPGEQGFTSPGADYLKDGVWYHVPTHRDIPIDDDKWSASPADAPLLALGHNLTRVLSSDNKAANWYDTNPPPKVPEDVALHAAYAQRMRTYLGKLALQAIENWGWILFWHGYLYTNGAPINFSQILEQGHSPYFNNLKIPDTQPIVVMDANNSRVIARPTWGELKNSARVTTAAFTKGKTVLALRRILQTLGNELRTAYPSLVVKDFTAEGLKLALFRALCETTLLQESLTYNQMLTATARYWRTRLRTVRAVHTQPPALVMMQDGTVDLAFNFESRPSTEGRPHRGYVKFVPARGGTNWLQKLKDTLGRAAQGITRFFGKKVPPQILKGSDLRKMLVEVSCDCKDFRYRMSWANVKAGVTTAQGRTDNGQAPLITNPEAHPGFCKHILATVRYLTDDAEIEISTRFSRQQQETLARDRARFMREAEAAYEEMEAPEVPEEELEKPEEEEPETPEFRRLPPLPKPIAPAEPPSPSTPEAPPSPSYQSLQ